MRIDIMLIWKHNPGKTPDLLSGVNDDRHLDVSGTKSAKIHARRT